MTSLHVAHLLDRALAAQALLEERGREVEDEWQYVTDLVAAWRARLEAVRATRADEAASDETAAAVEAVAAECALIEDPHRAIDWLSTMPQVVLAALGERT